MDHFIPAPDKGVATTSAALDTRVPAAYTFGEQSPSTQMDTLNKVLGDAQSYFDQKPFEHQLPKPPTNFLSLSGELRNAIYEIALEDHHKLAGHKNHYCGRDGTTCPTRISDSRPALLRVSKQVRREVMSLYYERDVYAFLSYYHFQRKDSLSREYLQVIGVEQAAMIKRFKVELPRFYLSCDFLLALRRGDHADFRSEFEDLLGRNELLELGVKREAWQLQYDRMYLH